MKVNSMVLFFVLCFLFNMIATVLSKEFSLNNNWWYVFLAFLSSGLASAVWSLALKKGLTITGGTPVMSALLVITTVMIGFVFYREPFAWNKLVGMCFGVIAIILIAK